MIFFQVAELAIAGMLHTLLRFLLKVFVVVVKYFGHILTSHEIFFKIFDEPRNIFLCSIFIILFFKLKALKHKTSQLAIKDI